MVWHVTERRIVELDTNDSHLTSPPSSAITYRMVGKWMRGLWWKDPVLRVTRPPKRGKFLFILPCDTYHHQPSIPHRILNFGIGSPHRMRVRWRMTTRHVAASGVGEARCKWSSSSLITHPCCHVSRGHKRGEENKGEEIPTPKFHTSSVFRRSHYIYACTRL